MISQDPTLPSIYDGLHQIAEAITPTHATGMTDESGTFVSCLTEAIVGMTAAMVRIAEAIESTHE